MAIIESKTTIIKWIKDEKSGFRKALIKESMIFSYSSEEDRSIHVKEMNAKGYKEKLGMSGIDKYMASFVKEWEAPEGEEGL